MNFAPSSEKISEKLFISSSFPYVREYCEKYQPGSTKSGPSDILDVVLLGLSRALIILFAIHKRFIVIDLAKIIKNLDIPP